MCVGISMSAVTERLKMLPSGAAASLRRVQSSIVAQSSLVYTVESPRALALPLTGQKVPLNVL